MCELRAKFDVVLALLWMRQAWSKQRNMLRGSIATRLQLNMAPQNGVPRRYLWNRCCSFEVPRLFAGVIQESPVSSSHGARNKILQAPMCVPEYRRPPEHPIPGGMGQGCSISPIASSCLKCCFVISPVGFKGMYHCWKLFFLG